MTWSDAIKQQREAVEHAEREWKQAPSDPLLEEAAFLNWQAELMKQSALALRIKASGETPGSHETELRVSHSVYPNEGVVAHESHNLL